MIYKCKLGTEECYTTITGSNIVRILKLAEQQMKENSSLKILEIRDSKNKIIDLQEYNKRQNRVKRADKEGYLTKIDIAKCYRSVQQMLWKKYKGKEYAKIKTELRKIKDSSKNIEEFKEKVQNYINLLKY